MKNTLLALSFVFLLTPVISEANTGVVAQVGAKTLFGTLTSHFSRIHTLSYTAERTTKGRRQSTRERWTLSYEAPSLIRVDYQYPSERLLIITTNALTEYIPALRRAIQTNLGNMSESERTAIIRQTLARISLDGINPSNFQDMATRATSVSALSKTSEIYRITGANPKFVIDLDQQQRVLLTTDIYTAGGDLMLHTEASMFIEAGPGFWYPQLLKAGYLTEQGFVTTSATLSTIKINNPLPEDTFQFTPPAHTTVEKR